MHLAIWSWRRGCRSSSGAVFPTKSCSPSRKRGRLRDPKTLERQIQRMIADPKSQALVDELRGAVAPAAQHSQCDARQERLSEFRPHAATGVRARAGIVRREHHSREAQRSGIADGRLHVCERAARAALRDSQHLRKPLPESLGPRRDAPRAVGQGRHPADDVARGSHVARGARQMDSRQPCGFASSSAASRCASTSRYSGARSR